MNQAKPPSIVHQQLALDVYLQTLLDEVPEAEDDAVAETVEAARLVAREALSTAPESVPVVVSSPDVAVKTLVRTRQAKLVEPENPVKLQALSVMPDWAQYEFQALFFKVDQLILATPLIELSRTIKIDRKPSKIPGQPSWFMGLLDEHDDRIGVLDTCQLIFGKNRSQQRNQEDYPFKRILITQDKKWGLACDEILSIGKVKPDGVRWRTARQKKPWLIGTIIDELTAIIDVKQLVPHRKNS